MRGIVCCPACSREQPVHIVKRANEKLTPAPAAKCGHCNAGVGAARVLRMLDDDAAPAPDPPAAASEAVELDPRALVERNLDSMLDETDWSRIPLAKKLAIAAEVAR